MPLLNRLKLLYKTEISVTFKKLSGRCYTCVLYLITEMKKRTETIKGNELDKYDLHQKVISSLSIELGIPDLRAGNPLIASYAVWSVMSFL